MSYAKSIVGITRIFELCSFTATLLENDQYQRDSVLLCSCVTAKTILTVIVSVAIHHRHQNVFVAVVSLLHFSGIKRAATRETRQEPHLTLLKRKSTCCVLQNVSICNPWPKKMTLQTNRVLAVFPQNK